MSTDACVHLERIRGYFLLPLTKTFPTIASLVMRFTQRGHGGHGHTNPGAVTWLRTLSRTTVSRVGVTECEPRRARREKKKETLRDRKMYIWFESTCCYVDITMTACREFGRLCRGGWKISIYLFIGPQWKGVVRSQMDKQNDSRINRYMGRCILHGYICIDVLIHNYFVFPLLSIFVYFIQLSWFFSLVYLWLDKKKRNLRPWQPIFPT